MKITYTSSPITNPALANLRQWVINIQDSTGIFKSIEEIARVLELWRSKDRAPEAQQVEVVLFSSDCILIKDQSRGEYVQVDQAKEVSHE
jgi:hypothetical protein